jgi:hypothetical protein
MTSRPFPLAHAADPSREQLAALEAQVAARETALAALKTELQELQTRYLADVGHLYAERDTLEAAIAEEEIRQGLRSPTLDEPEDDGAPDAATCDECISRSIPSIDLKRIFRDVAKAIHPDRARDDAARFRRHSLMAEANRAYAERDEDRLRLILKAWERSPEAIVGDGPEADAERHQRRLGALGDRLVQIEAEFADLRDSAIGRLKRRIDETRAQGWDLFAEMVHEVRRQIRRASARLATLRRTANAPPQ